MRNLIGRTLGHYRIVDADRRSRDGRGLPGRGRRTRLENIFQTWNFQTTQPTVSGRCPAGTAVAGTAAITQKGNAVTLRYVSGAKCNPAAVCSYDGTLDEEENQFVAANSVTVDSEGGTVTSAIRLTVYSNGFADGNGTNHYVHPKGFECRWNMNVFFTRELEEDKK